MVWSLLLFQKHEKAETRLQERDQKMANPSELHKKIISMKKPNVYFPSSFFGLFSEK